MTKDEALKLALEALEPEPYLATWYIQECVVPAAITAIKAALLSRSDGEAKDEKQKPVNIKKVAEEHGINLPTEFVPKHDESKAAIQSLTDQCAALIWERDELQKQMWRSEKQEPVTWRYKIVDVFGRPVWTLKTPKSDTRVLESQPLYTTPPQRKPLSDEEISVLRQQHGITSDGRGIKEWTRVVDFARAIEAAVWEKQK